MKAIFACGDNSNISTLDQFNGAGTQVAFLARGSGTCGIELTKNGTINLTGSDGREAALPLCRRPT